MKLIIGKVKNNSNDEVTKRLEGLELVLIESGFLENKYLILGGADDESQEKLTEVLYKTSGDWLGFDNLEDFRKAWKDGNIDGGGFYIDNQDIQHVLLIKSFAETNN